MSVPAAAAAEQLLHGLAGLASEVDVEEAVDDGVDGVVDEVELEEDLGGGEGAHGLGLLEVLDHGTHHHDGQGRKEAEHEGHGDGEQHDGGAAHVQVAGVGRQAAEAGPLGLGGAADGGGGGGHGGVGRRAERVELCGRGGARAGSDHLFVTHAGHVPKHTVFR